MGLGEIQYPEPNQWLPAESFEATDTADYISPRNGFEKVLNSENEPGYLEFLGDSEIETAWSAIQPFIKVREYIRENPDQKAKIYFYTPTVDSVDPSVAKWIIFLCK